MRRNTDQITIDALKRERKRLESKLVTLELQCGFNSNAYKEAHQKIREAFKVQDFEAVKIHSEEINLMDEVLRHESMIMNSGDITMLRCELDDIDTLINLMRGRAA